MNRFGRRAQAIASVSTTIVLAACATAAVREPTDGSRMAKLASLADAGDARAYVELMRTRDPHAVPLGATILTYERFACRVPVPYEAARRQERCFVYQRGSAAHPPLRMDAIFVRRLTVTR